MRLLDNKEPIHAAIVLLLDSSALRFTTVAELESKLGAVVEVVQKLPGPEGILELRVPKRHLEITISRNRVQFSLGGEFVAPEAAKEMAEAVHAIAGHIDDAQWRTIGYNYNFVFQAPEGKSAVEAISSTTFDIEGLSTRIGHRVKGSALWLYLEVKNKRLWLRLEPRGGDSESRLVWVYGNFDQQLNGELPDRDQLADEFAALSVDLDNIIQGLCDGC